MTILVGDCREVLAGLSARSVQTCVTSPPYFGLRDYGTGEWEGGDPSCDHKTPPSFRHTTLGTASGGNAMSPEARARFAEGQRTPYRNQCPHCGARRVDRQVGLEPTPDEFVAAMVTVFREVRRVLRDDGTVWLNLGDSYSMQSRSLWNGCKPKDLLMIPAQVALALRADGWYLRSDIIWAKPNPMPESVTDRPTNAHEHLFLLSKGPRYFYDADAIREGFADERQGNPGAYHHTTQASKGANMDRADLGFLNNGNGWNADGAAAGRNRRNVWTVATQPYAGAHFATFPPKLIEPCILAGTPPKCCGVCGAPWRRVVERVRRHANGDAPTPTWANDGMVRLTASGRRNDVSTSIKTTGWEPTCGHHDDTGRAVVLDPFAGAGTTGVVCGWHGREFVGVELNPNYAAMAEARIALEGRPGGRPNGHEPTGVIPGQGSLFG